MTWKAPSNGSYLLAARRAGLCRTRCRRLSNFVEAHPGDLTSGARLLEVRVRRIVHHAGMTWFFFDFTSAHGAAS